MLSKRVSLPGYNALTETNLDRFALYADADNILIKEKARGSGTISLTSSQTITHNLGYVPAFFVLAEVASGTYRMVNAQNPIGGGWSAYSTTTDLVITNNYSATYTGYRYYIFYDRMGTSGSTTITESDFVSKVSISGANALTSTNPNDYIFHSDLNTFKILAEGNLTTQTVDADPKTFTVAHGRSSTPAVTAFAKFPDGYVCQAGSKERADNVKPIERYWFLEVDATNVRFIFYKGTTANYNVNIKYFVFEGPGT